MQWALEQVLQGSGDVTQEHSLQLMNRPADEPELQSGFAMLLPTPSPIYVSRQGLEHLFKAPPEPLSHSASSKGMRLWVHLNSLGERLNCEET